MHKHESAIEQLQYRGRVFETGQDIQSVVKPYYRSLADRIIQERCHNLEAWGRVVRRVQRWRDGGGALAAIERIRAEVERI